MGLHGPWPHSQGRRVGLPSVRQLPDPEPRLAGAPGQGSALLNGFQTLRVRQKSLLTVRMFAWRDGVRARDGVPCPEDERSASRA